jgi:hypothetical protein
MICREERRGEERREERKRRERGTRRGKRRGYLSRALSSFIYILLNRLLFDGTIDLHELQGGDVEQLQFSLQKGALPFQEVEGKSFS